MVPHEGGFYWLKIVPTCSNWQVVYVIRRTVIFAIPGMNLPLGHDAFHREYPDALSRGPIPPPATKQGASK